MRHQQNTFKKFTLALGVCAAALMGGAHTSHAEGMTDAQKEEIQAIVKDYIMSNPQVILDTVEQYRMEQEKLLEKNAQESLSDYKEYFARDDLTIAGNPDGDITVVEFFDYNCGYCRKAFEDVRKIIQTDPNVRVVFQEMPILSPSSKTMAQIALAAHEQGKYFEMHTAFMDHRGNQSDEVFYNLAKDVGLDMDQLKKDMVSPKVTAVIGKSADMGRKLGIRGTPGFIIGDEIYPGYIGLEAMKKAISDARMKNAE